MFFHFSFFLHFLFSSKKCCFFFFFFLYFFLNSFIAGISIRVQLLMFPP